MKILSESRIKEHEKTAKLKNFFIFGYGSLMYPWGINGRGMSYRYGWSNIQTALLDNFKRGMFGSFDQVGFYGILANKYHHMNGVVFKIRTGYDLRQFLISEGAASGQAAWIKKLTYNVANVTRHVSGVELPPEARVYTLVCDVDNGTMFPPRRGYQAEVFKGIERWGNDFTRVFLSTGGVRPKKKKPVIKQRHIKRR